MNRVARSKQLFCVQNILNVHVRRKNDIPKNEKSNTKSKRYSNTLNLPQTSFPLSMKNGAAAQRELEIQQTKGFQSLYQWQRKQNWDKEFVLHDGPPYANGRLHVGHVVNKVLKDIMNRYKVMKKHKVHYVPGWDCHGMPIETKAITNMSGAYQTSQPLEIRAKAKQFAEKVLEEQKTSFQRWGVMGDWENVYRTLAPEYEAKQLEVFYKIYEKGYIYRSYMPVYWSPSSHSALAEAELEYKSDHVSKSAYIRFPVTNLADQIRQVIGHESRVHALIWTTTPWTLPFNQAICYNPKVRYIFARDEKTQHIYICEEAFIEKLTSLLAVPLAQLMTIEGSTLQGVVYKHPLTNEELPFLASSHVTPGKGTGLVHTAPAHGHDDFNVAVRHGLKTECHVDERGSYISGVDSVLIGKTVGVDADDAVIAALGPHVVTIENFSHSYPYDWRTKQPVIIRASQQWFFDVQALKQLALECLSKVKITPQNSEHGMMAELMSRPYWCISRQRSWGVSIPIFYHKLSGDPFITRETVEHVISLVQTHGSDCWWKLPIEELLPNHLLAKLNKGDNKDYKKGEDILDIWFDSGVSWASVLKDYGGQADVYLEGIDQFKGWFQTSLLTSLAVNGRAPYRQLITHGFVADEEGKKMSKSVGNVIDPAEVISGGQNKDGLPSYGVDILRWWVAHSHHHQTIMVGPVILQQLQEDVFKVRRCVRHLLGNLFDFDPKSDIVPYFKLTTLDKYMLHILHTTMQQIEDAYESVSFHKVIQQLEKFFYSDLSSFYISNTKDRCYCDVSDGESRRSSQTVQYYVTKSITSAFAPIAPHLAEEVYRHIPGIHTQNSESDSVFKHGWCPPHAEWDNPEVASNLMPVFDMRRSLTDALGPTESPIDFDVLIYSSPVLHDLLRAIQPEVTSATSSLCEIFQTSQVSVLDTPPPVIPDDTLIVQGTTLVHQTDDVPGQGMEVDYKMLVAPALLHICERCRRYTAQHASSPCDRCLNAVAHDWSA
ncbi:hypothetical protein BsWGS_14734 [Bradybaena similaris]